MALQDTSGVGSGSDRIFSEATDRSINIHADRSGKSDPFCVGDIRDLEHMIQVFKETQPEIVFHLGGTADRKGILQKSGKYL